MCVCVCIRVRDRASLASQVEQRYRSRCNFWLPGLVQVIVGDVGEKEVIKNAMIGVNKVIYCASAKTSVTSDLYNVADQGAYTCLFFVQTRYVYGTFWTGEIHTDAIEAPASVSRVSFNNPT